MPMRLGVSSYSFARSLESGRMSFTDVIDRAAELGLAHVEVASMTDRFLADPAFVDEVREHAAAKGVELANYVIGADFRAAADASGDTGAPGDTDAPGGTAAGVPDVDEQLEHVRAHLDVAHRLGVTRFRHDVVAWAWRDADQDEYERTFQAIVPICRRLADHAAPLGITTTVENHGFFINNSERLRRLVAAVDRPNFRMLLDVGNFLCLDEDPLAAVPRSLPMAAVVHLKDFLVRDERPGDGWLETAAGRHILGTIVGHGDLPVRRLVRIIHDSGFDGPISIEFEGVEPDDLAVERGVANARAAWEATTTEGAHA